MIVAQCNAIEGVGKNSSKEGLLEEDRTEKVLQNCGGRRRAGGRRPGGWGRARGGQRAGAVAGVAGKSLSLRTVKNEEEREVGIAVDIERVHPVAKWGLVNSNGGPRTGVDVQCKEIMGVNPRAPHHSTLCSTAWL